MVAATLQWLAALLAAVSACLCLASSALAQAPSPATLPFVRNERLASVLSDPASQRWTPDPAPVQPVDEVRPADYPEPPNWSRLVFQSYRDRNWEIYTSNEEGGGLQRLTYRTGTDARP